MEIVAGDFWQAEQICIGLDDITRDATRHQLPCCGPRAEVALSTSGRRVGNVTSCGKPGPALGSWEIDRTTRTRG